MAGHGAGENQGLVGIESLRFTANYRRCNGHHNLCAATTMRRKICTCAFFCALALVAWIATLLLSGVVVCVAGARDFTVWRQCGTGWRASGTWAIEGDKQTFPLQTT